METGSSTNGRGSSSANGHVGQQRELGVLGEDPHTTIPSLRPKKLSFRPADIVRLLNSTPLGTVISDRQFYQHRQRAGLRICQGKGVDFLRYVSWLIERRHSRPKPDASPFDGVLTPERNGTTPTHGEILQILQRQRYRCALTGSPLTPTTASLDHIVPISRDGSHHVSNAQVLRKDVNRAKGTLTNDEFIALCKEVVAHVTKSDGPAFNE